MITDKEFEGLVEKLNTRKKRFSLLGKEDCFEYKIDAHKNQIEIVNYEPKDEKSNSLFQTVSIPDFVTHINCQVRNKENGILKIILGKNLISIKNLLQLHTGKVVILEGGQDKLKEIESLASGQNIDTLEINLDKSVKPISLQNMLRDSNIKHIKISQLDMSKVDNMRGFMHSTRGITHIDLTNFDLSSVTDMSSQFRNSDLLQVRLSGTLRQLEKTNGMFSSCRNLKEVHFEKQEQPIKLKSATEMFSMCAQLEKLELGSLDFQQQDAGQLFNGCRKLKKISNQLDFQNQGHLVKIFKDCSSLEHIDTSELKMQSAYNMTGLLCGCTKLQQVKLKELGKTIKIGRGLLKECVSLNHIEFDDTAKFGRDTSQMFMMSGLDGSIDLTGLFDCTESTLINAQYMFFQCKQTEIILGKDFVIDKQTVVNNMIQQCDALERIEFNGQVQINRAQEMMCIDNPKLKEIAFLGGLYININSDKLYLIDMCPKLEIIKTQNSIDISKIVPNDVSKVNMYKEGKYFVYELVRHSKNSRDSLNKKSSIA